MHIQFDRNKHVYQSDDFEELIKDTLRFFNGTPVHELPPPKKFHGPGVYAIYYIGKLDIYNKFYTCNRTSFELPIYVGKAVPRGWRQGRSFKDTISYELYGRLKEHSRNIDVAKNLILSDFKCRFMILEKFATNMIGTVEAALIRHYTPLWNTYVDGFGNHTPGNGRFNQAKSDWDVIHPGRPWANKCKGEHSTKEQVDQKIAAYFNELKG